MRFMRPELAIWFLVLPVAVACWSVQRYVRRAFWQKAALNTRAAALSRLSGRVHGALGVAAAAVTLASLVTAVMRPQIAWEWEKPHYEQLDLIVVLDRSVSMRAQDIRPSRFSRAIQEIKTFLRRKPQGIDRVALVGFAETALILSHLTRDVDSLYFFLDWIEEDPEAYFGTDLGAALASARDVIQRDTQATRKIVLIVSDGDNQGTRLGDEIAGLRSEDSRVYAIGIGSDVAVTIPLFPGGTSTQPLTDDRGRPLTTKFDEATLRDIAGTTRGRYYRSVTGSELLAAMNDVVVRERRIVGLERSTEYRDVHRLAIMVAAVALCLLL